MGWMNVLNLAVAIGTMQSPGLMPQKLYQDLDSGDGVWALSELKRHPKLVNTRGAEERETPLLLASCRGHIDAVRWLVAHGADVNAKCYNDFTPLLLAANGQIATILLKSGAKVSVRSAFGATPMQYAAEQGGDGLKSRLEVVNAIRRFGVPLDLMSALLLDWRKDARKILREHPGEATSECVSGRTPLHIAAHNGDIETAKLLLNAGAILDSGVQPGMNFGSGTFTPLCSAVWAEKADMVEFLCEKGANPNKMGDQLRRALSSPSIRIRTLLKKYSALRHP